MKDSCQFVDISTVIPKFYQFGLSSREIALAEINENLDCGRISALLWKLVSNYMAVYPAQDVL